MTLGQAVDYVFDFFKDDTKACAWFLTGNPNFGGIKPIDLVWSGRKEKVINFIEAAKLSTKAPTEEAALEDT